MKSRMVKYVSLLMGVLGVFGNSYCFGAKGEVVLKDRRSKAQKMFPGDNGVKPKKKFRSKKTVGPETISIGCESIVSDGEFGEFKSDRVKHLKEFLKIFVVCKLLSESIFGVPKVYDKISCEILRRSVIDAISLSDDISNKEEAKRFVENMRFQTMSRFIDLVYAKENEVYIMSTPPKDRKSYFLRLCRLFFGNDDGGGRKILTSNPVSAAWDMCYVRCFAQACLDTDVFSLSNQDNRYVERLGYPFDIRIFTSSRNYGTNGYDYARFVNDWLTNT